MTIKAQIDTEEVEKPDPPEPTPEPAEEPTHPDTIPEPEPAAIQVCIDRTGWTHDRYLHAPS